MDDREFLTNWLLESVPLLGDELHPERLERMTFSQLFELAEERQAKLGEIAEAQNREADSLELYSRCKQAGIRGVMK